MARIVFSTTWDGNRAPVLARICVNEWVNLWPVFLACRSAGLARICLQLSQFTPSIAPSLLYRLQKPVASSTAWDHFGQVSKGLIVGYRLWTMLFSVLEGHSTADYFWGISLAAFASSALQWTNTHSNNSPSPAAARRASLSREVSSLQQILEAITVRSSFPHL